MAETLQHSQAAQRPWIQTAGAGEHRTDGPGTGNALTMKADHFVGADQSIGATYKRCAYLTEKRRALDGCSRELCHILSQSSEEEGNVISLYR